MREVTPDKAKARSLLKMANKTMRRIKRTDIEEFPSQALKDYYSVSKQLMEALSCLEGIKMEGKGAHKKLINWVVRNYDFSESNRRLLQQFRKNRNRIIYEGFFVTEDYLLRNREKIEEIIRGLREKVEQEINSSKTDSK